jgi:hypothetical protein
MGTGADRTRHLLVEETVLFDVECSDPSARVMFFFAGIPDDQAVVVEGVRTCTCAAREPIPAEVFPVRQGTTQPDGSSLI